MGATQRLMIGLVALLFATGAGAEEMRIQFAEKVTIAAAAGHTEFDAYGRRFSLALENNTRLLAGLPAAQKGEIPVSQLLRGKLEGAPGSWVRLARVGGGLEGAIWDGSDLYVVTRHASIAAHLVQPIQAGASDTVVYRLSDAQNLLPENFCGLARDLPRSNIDRSALKMYQSTVAELRANALAIPTDQMEVAIIADQEMQLRYLADTRDIMLARLNTVDGIFSEQVGVLLIPSVVRLVPSSGNPFTSSNAERLLDQLSTYRTGDAAVRAAGIAHLMTGKRLNDNIAGIAYIDALCDTVQGVSLSDSVFGEIEGALVMAHELGHNFGANHDGVSGSGCEAVPQYYLMAPTVNYSSQFSQCSLNAMRPKIALARGRCIGPAVYADVAVALPGSPYVVDTSAAFSLPVTVTAAGTIASQAVRVRFDLPSDIAYQSTVVPNGSCAANSNGVDCTLGDIPAGEQRTFDLRLLSNVVGTHTVVGTVSSDNDRFASNNTSSVQVGLRSAVDLGVTMTASAASVFATDTVDFTIDVRSTRSQAAQGGFLNFGLYNFTIESVNAGGHACVVNPGYVVEVRCQLADIPGGGTSRVIVRARSLQAGTYQASAFVGVTNDGDYSNNSAFVGVSVLAEREVKTRASAEYLNVVIGVPFEITYTLTAAGRLPADEVTHTIYDPGEWFVNIQSIVPSAGTCTRAEPPGPIECAFGTLNPGDVRTVVIRLRTNVVGQSWLTTFTRYSTGAGNDSFFYNYVSTVIYSYQRVDARVDLNYASTIDEGQTGPGSFYLQSQGVDPARDVVATLTLPTPARLTAIYISFGPPGFQCVLVDPQTARCSGSFPAESAQGTLGVGFRFTSDSAMTGVATVSVTATDDADPANNSAQTNIQVRPFSDIGLSKAVSAKLLVDGGSAVDVDMTLTTGRNPVVGASFWAGSSGYLLVESIRIDGVVCQPTGPSPGQLTCALGDLPANTSLPVSVRYRAEQMEYESAITAGVSAVYDSNYTNDSVVIEYLVQLPTDIQVAVQQTSGTTLRGSQFMYPNITVTNGGSAFARNVVVDISVPSFASVVSLSASGVLCTGTTTLQCSYGDVWPGQSKVISMVLRADAVGSATSEVTVTASNDSRPDNNRQSVALSVTEPPPPPPTGGSSSGGGSSSSGGAKKGGGSLEWLALAFLGLLALQRARSVRQQIRIAHERHVRAVR